MKQGQRIALAMTVALLASGTGIAWAAVQAEQPQSPATPTAGSPATGGPAASVQPTPPADAPAPSFSTDSTGPESDQASAPLMRYPTIHGDDLVFEAGGNLWKTTTDGGQAQQLTSDPGFDSNAHFSPDGRWIAFTGWYQGNTDVYVIPASGGQAQRLTYHSINDAGDDGKIEVAEDNRVVAWTPDSKQVVFLSRRDSFNPQVIHAYTVPVTGGLPVQLPIPWTGPLSFGPNDHTVAYNKLNRVYRPFHRKKYFGGEAQDIWTFDWKTGKSQQITHWKGADVWPMWQGDSIYFSSDRGTNHVQNLWVYSQTTHQFTQLTHFDAYDIDAPTQGAHAITFSEAGDLYVYDTDHKQLKKLAVQVPLDGSRAQPHWADGSDDIQAESLAPNGKLAVFSAKGALFTVPAKYGSTQNLTTDPAADERSPAWSPDGKHIAYIGAKHESNAIYIRSATGGKAKKITHAKDVSYQGPITWSPDNKYVTYIDSNQTLWLENVKSGDRQKIANDPTAPGGTFGDVTWAPGSQWLAFSQALQTPLGNITLTQSSHAIFLYHLADHSLHRISSGQFADYAPVFSHDGQYLFFASDRIINPTFSRFDEITAGLKSSGLYAATLQAKTASPIAPRVRRATSGHDDDEGDAVVPASADDNTVASAGSDSTGDKGGSKSKSAALKVKATAEKKNNKPVKIDLAGLMDRAVRLPVPQADIGAIAEAKGVVYYTTQPSQTIDGPLADEKAELRAYDMKQRKDHTLATDISGFELSADGSTLFYKQNPPAPDQGGNSAAARNEQAGDSGGAPPAAPGWVTRPASFVVNPGPDAVDSLDLGQVKRWMQPTEVWPTVYGEAMRDVMDYFQNPVLIRKIWPAIDARYKRLLPRVASRDDVNWLIANAIGTPGESHMYVKKGDMGFKTPDNPTGDLGADFALDKASGRYRLARIYKGDNTVPDYEAPLNQPGLKVKTGDFVLAINGQPLQAPTNPYALLEGTAGSTISLKIADNASGKGAHLIYVNPVDNADNLHLLAWIRHNRGYIAKVSNGQIGYVYLEDMGSTGMKEFIRQYYSQMHKKAIIFDDRWNLGGFIDPMLFDRMDRQITAMFMNRYRAASPTPNAPMGYMAALINRGSASDGDIFAYMFKKDRLGPTIGSRTWAGVRGYNGPFPLLDGGFVIVSDETMYGLDGKWNVENIGVSPDVTVHNEPGDLNAGHDAQIDKAVQMLMQKIHDKPKVYPQAPAWMPAFPPQPNYPDCGSSDAAQEACD